MRLITCLFLAVAAVCVLAWPASVSAAPAVSAAASQPASQPTSGPAEAVAAASSAAAATVDPTEEAIQKIKHPVSWLKWGADERLRWEYYNNYKLNKEAPNHEANYLRSRTRLWTSFMPTKDVDINVRGTWEFRNYFEPEELTDTDLSEMVFDSLNVQMRNFLTLPLTMTVGRQDITNLGTGWLVFDGTPLDSSRTVYFDAVRGTWDFKPAKTTLDAIYLNDAAAQDRWIEPLGDREKLVIEQDEQGVILWLANKSIARTELGAFFIYKQDNPVAANGEDGEIYSIGGRAAGQIDKNWRYRADVAPEFGHKFGEELAAFGADTQLAYFLNDRLNNNFRMTYEYLSGDDPETKRNEGFDPLWGRWAQWSDLYANVIATETTGRPAYWTNLQRVGPGWTINPLANAPDKMRMCLDYYLLFANENTRAGHTGFSDDGLFRGQLVTWLLEYKFNDHIKTFVQAEFFFPGNYYDDTMNDPAAFLRYEICFTF